MKATSLSLLVLPLLFCLVFLADKVVWIGSVYERGRTEATPLEYLLLNIDVIKQAGPERHPWVVFIGSSRSEFFQHLHPENLKVSGLSTDALQDLAAVEWETRLPFKAASMLASFTFLERLLRPGNQPDLVIFEYSPEMLNRNGPFQQEVFFRGNPLEPAILRRLFLWLDLAGKWEVGLRLAFPGYHYHVRVERAFSEAKPVDPVLSWILFSARPRFQALPSNYVDFDAASIPGKDYQERFVDYSNYLQKDFVLKEYSVNPVEIQALRESVALAQEAGVPLLFWKPPVHVELGRRLQATEYAELGPAIEADLRRLAPYLTFEAEPLSCQRFVDSSHLSARCAPELAHRLLQAARQHYPGKF